VRCRALRFSSRNRLYSPPILGADVAAQILQARGVLRSRDGMISEDVDVIALRTAQANPVEPNSALDSTRVFLPLRRLAPDAPVEFVGRKARVAGAPSVRADQARGCGQVASACFANGETLPTGARAKQQLRRLLSSCS